MFTRNHHPGNDTKKHRRIRHLVCRRKMGWGGWRGWGNVGGSCVPSSGLLDVVGSGKITLRTRSKKRQKAEEDLSDLSEKEAGSALRNGTWPCRQGAHPAPPLPSSERPPHQENKEKAPCFPPHPLESI